MMMGDEAALTLGIPLRFLLVSLCDNGGCADSSLSGNLWDYWICWSDYSTFSSRVSRNELQEAFPVATLLGALFVIWADVLSRIIIQTQSFLLVFSQP